MHLCMASSIRAMPEKEKPPAMRVDLYSLLIFHKNFLNSHYSYNSSFVIMDEDYFLLACYLERT